MANLAIVVVLLVVFVCQGFSKPLLEDGDIAKAAEAGDWAGVQKLLKQYVESSVTPPAELLQKSAAQLGSLQANEPSYVTTGGGSSPAGRYYSQSEYSYQRKTNNNGVVSEDKGGLGMIDNNGRVTYYKPDPNSYASGLNPAISAFAPNFEKQDTM